MSDKDIPVDLASMVGDYQSVTNVTKSQNPSEYRIHINGLFQGKELRYLRSQGYVIRAISESGKIYVSK